ncbi:MAG: putative sulfate/molybdate transporter [Candidatus Nanopelagicales bacterium]|nr:putative sulfate/molybdate transporter [Candidatus Nanopelagicales bacterium]
MATITRGAEVRPSPGVRGDRARLWWHEASGSVADLGVLIPIAVALIVANGLGPTAVLLPAALAYLVVAVVYRVPVAVQPLKAFGAVAIAAGAGPDVIAAGSILMGVIFLLLGTGDWINRAAAWFPTPVIRGIQLSVGLLFVKVAWGLATSPQPAFTDQAPQPALLLTALVLFGLLVILRGRIILVVVVLAIGVAVIAAGSGLTFGPSAISMPTLSFDAFATAAVLLVLPQLPLTFANSCLAPADAARTYFGDAAERVTPGKLARTLGSTNILAGAISGMPVCHGAGGMTAHYTFGARTWRAPLLIGSALLVLAIGFGNELANVLPAFPLFVLAALLMVAGVAHMMLLRDLSGTAAWTVALGVGVIGVLWNLAPAMVIGLVASAIIQWSARRLSGASDGDVGQVEADLSAEAKP